MTIEPIAKTKPLDNHQHEKMSRGLAMGMTQKDAYIDAGYSPEYARQNATTLAKKAVIRNRVRELKIEFAEDEIQKKIEREDEIVETKAPALDGQDGFMTKQDFHLTEMWLVDVLRDNISGAQRDGKWKEANAAVQMLGNYMGGLFDAKTPTKPEDLGDRKKDKDKKKPIDIAAIAAAMNAEEDDNVKPSTEK